MIYMDTQLIAKCTDLAWNILIDYKSSLKKYTQEKLSEKYDIPVKVIGNVTKDFGFSHTKTDLQVFMCKDSEKFLYLAPYIR